MAQKAPGALPGAECHASLSPPLLRLLLTFLQPEQITRIPMFQTSPILDHIRRWVEIESPTERPDQINRLVDLVIADHAGLPVDIERVAGTEGHGDH